MSKKKTKKLLNKTKINPREVIFLTHISEKIYSLNIKIFQCRYN